MPLHDFLGEQDSLNFGRATNNRTGIGGSLGFGDTTDTGDGLNFFGKGGIAGMALGGIQTLGNLWQSFQATKLAKKQFKFQKNAFNTNLANQTKVYNTALEDRIRARFHTEGKSTADADARISETKL